MCPYTLLCAGMDALILPTHLPRSPGFTSILMTWQLLLQSGWGHNSNVLLPVLWRYQLLAKAPTGCKNTPVIRDWLRFWALSPKTASIETWSCCLEILKSELQPSRSVKIHFHSFWRLSGLRVDTRDECLTPHKWSEKAMSDQSRMLSCTPERLSLRDTMSPICRGHPTHQPI